VIRTVFPQFGPRSGGTQLSVHGQNLDIGSRLEVYASSQICAVVRYQPIEFCFVGHPFADDDIELSCFAVVYQLVLLKVNGCLGGIVVRTSDL